MNRYRLTIWIASLIFILPTAVASSSPEELLSAIENKAIQLEEINLQIQTTQKNIDSLDQEAKTLNKEIQKFDYTINQVNLSIKSSEVKIDKLNLELEVLDNKIGVVEEGIDLRKDAIGEALRKIQQKDGENFIEIFLKNKSLVDGVIEIQGLKDLQNGLTSSVEQLGILHNDLDLAINDATAKKGDVENEHRTLSNRRSILSDQKSEKADLLRGVKNKENLYQQQILSLEKQQSALSDEIEKIEDDLRARFDTSLLPSKRPGVLSWPIKLVKDGGVGRITQHAGQISRLYGGRPHNGLDIGAPVGTPVFAAGDGVAVAVDNNDKSSRAKYQYGKYVLIKHNNNLATLYAHLSKQVVSVGDNVKSGDLIGYSGNTGYSTGPHLHFGVYGSPAPIIRCPISINIPLLCLVSKPPAAGFIPVGPYIDPEDYL